MKKQFVAVTLLSILGSPTTSADTLPEQYAYQVALFNGDDLLYKHSSFTVDGNRFSNGTHIPYFIKTCEKKGTKTINKSAGKQFYQGVGYQIDVHAATVTFVETVIDESTYIEPQKDEFNLCMNTGEPQEKEYKYNAIFDLKVQGVQQFTFDNNRRVEIIVQKEG
ncbi:TPA: hypothetical protein I7264_03135 [Vibrio parahaemolyticus]|uniref:Uncharacterized protein n=2 Tax=Vibrio TaxID=662 RepID=A0AA47JM46_VIBPH|nr:MULTISPECIES: hypothetical protein [Vibrio]ELY5142027.1 hypothetical protein [Vibrio vulnificus]MBE3697020.1 hypothetical protein [Vibrio parahaemolyticus]MBE3777027.1 hypothetical protein [Vibrio parahaemolyticus]MBE4418169.1 hypothetical protein [Vibrio parahaemolyticus]MBN8083223.1 hypothetical protein [Vibrio vulnificus]